MHKNSTLTLGDDFPDEQHREDDPEDTHALGGINTSVNPAMVIGIFSQWWVRTRYPRWFTKYNYVVAAALDGGTQVISFILNFVSILSSSLQPKPDLNVLSFSSGRVRCGRYCPRVPDMVG